MSLGQASPLSRFLLLSPAHYPLTRLRNIHFKNINGEAQSAGTMYGFKETPFGNDTFFFENCHIKAQKGLSISNVANVNFKGLELEIKEGEKIYERPVNKARQPNKNTSK